MTVSVATVDDGVTVPVARIIADAPIVAIEVLDTSALHQALALAWTALDGFDDEDVLQEYDVDLATRAVAMELLGAIIDVLKPTT